MRRLGIGARVAREGLVHAGTTLAVDDAPFHVDFAELVNGAAITVYGQSEVMKDLNLAADERQIEVIYEATDAARAALRPILPGSPGIRRTAPIAWIATSSWVATVFTASARRASRAMC